VTPAEPTRAKLTAFGGSATRMPIAAKIRSLSKETWESLPLALQVCGVVFEVAGRPRTGNRQLRRTLGDIAELSHA
jgi:hypothetical protein